MRCASARARHLRNEPVLDLVENKVCGAEPGASSERSKSAEKGRMGSGRGGILS
eukprot:SM000037S13544  [mRNA]  locus=s37:528299:528460:- [translate_table: standard]